MIIPVYAAAAVLVLEYLMKKGPGDMSRLFFACYFFIHLVVTGLFVLFGRERWELIANAVIAGVMLVVFHDRVISVNLLSAFGVFLLIRILKDDRVSRFSWAVFIGVMAFLLIPMEDLSKTAAVSFVIVFLHAAASLLKRDLRYFMAVPVIMAIILAFIPAKEKPIQWEVVRKAIDGVKKIVNTAMNELQYNFEFFSDGDKSYLGYSGEGTFGEGIVSGRQREELRFDTNAKDTRVYLRGRSFLILDEKGAAEKEEEDIYNGWFVEFINALYHAGVDKETAGYFSELHSAQLEYIYLKTEDYICPENLIELDRMTTRDKNATKRKGEKYHVRYFTVDYGSPYLEKILLQARKQDYESYDTIMGYVKEIYNINIQKFMTEDQYNAAARSELSGDYLDNRMATDRIRELTEEVTADCSTDYEKALRIEAFLRQYSYSTASGNSAGNYVEGFLFETKSGYCVHFASAMVVMLRCCGIPARFSVGYMHQEGGAAMDYEKGMVMNYEAHAWPEAYIRGFGWVPFEPTPVMITAAGRNWGRGEKEAPDVSEIEKNEDSVHYIPDGPDMTGDGEGAAELQGEASGENLEKGIAVRVIKYSALILLILLAVTAVIVMILYLRYRLMPSEKKLRRNVDRICELLGDYPENLMDKGAELAELMENYLRVRFRGDPADEAMVKKSERALLVLRKQGKQV